MTLSLSEIILERGDTSTEQLEWALENQLARGQELAWHLVALGIFDEDELLPLLALRDHMSPGKPGKIPAPAPDVRAILPDELAVRYRVIPIAASAESLAVVSAWRCGPAALAAMREVTGRPIHVSVVASFRLNEALRDYYGVPLSEPERLLVEALEDGGGPIPYARFVALPAEPAAYRRMSELPLGIVASDRQPAVSSLHPQVEKDASRSSGSDHRMTQVTMRDDSSTAVWSSDHPTASLPENAPSGTQRVLPSGIPSRVPSSRAPASQTPSSEVPHSDAPSEQQGADLLEERRNTEPYRGSAPPISIPGEFTRHMSESPPSADAMVDESQRSFRHRGPFSRAQADLAATNAPDVQTVLEILARFARQYFERTILFTVQGAGAELRFAYGVELAQDSLLLPLDGNGVLGRARRLGAPIISALGPELDDQLLAESVGAGTGTVAVIPMMIRQRVVALLYGDDRDVSVAADSITEVSEFVDECSAEVVRTILERKTP